MSNESENHTLRLLQEIRKEISELREDLTTRIDGNTIILNMMAGLIHQHDERIENLENSDS